MARSIPVSDFARSGTFGTLAIGCGRDVVQELLGEPTDLGRGLGGAEILRYGDGRLEVSLLRDRVVLIAFYPGRGCDLAASAVTVHDDLPAGVSRSPKLFERWLEGVGLHFDVLIDDEELYSVRVQSGVVATFEKGRLDSLQATQAHRKQEA